jgi:hypothetical protein
MKLNDFAKPITTENPFVKVSFGGFAGSGKTRTAAEFIIGCYKKMKLSAPILFIDNEKGSRFMVPLFEKAGIETLVKETIYLGDVLSAFNYVNSGEISFLFIDSLTKIWYKYISDYKEKNGKKAFMTLQDWGKVLPAWQADFADKFVALNGNCVFTGRGGYTYDMEENDETKKKEFVKSGVKMKMAGETPFEPDLNIWMEIAQDINKDGHPVIWREALVMKDRSGIIDGKTFKNPTFKNFESVIDFLLKAKKGEIAGPTNTSNIAPTEQYQDKKKRIEIMLDKAKIEFDKREVGSSKEDKALKIAILEKAFGTASMTEIESKPIEHLEFCLPRLIELFQAWDQNKSIDTIKKHEFSLLTSE